MVSAWIVCLREGDSLRSSKCINRRDAETQRSAEFDNSGSAFSAFSLRLSTSAVKKNERSESVWLMHFENEIH